MCHERTGCAKRWPWEFNGPGRVAPSCFHLLETVLGVCVCLFGGFFAKSTRGGQQVRHRNCIEHWTVVNKKEITCADQMPHFWSAPILGWSPTGDGSESHGRCSTTDPRPVFSHGDTQMVSDKTGLFCKPFHSPIFSSLCSVTDYYLYYFFLALSLTISLLLFNPLYSLWNIGLRQFVSTSHPVLSESYFGDWVSSFQFIHERLPPYLLGASSSLLSLGLIVPLRI